MTHSSTLSRPTSIAEVLALHQKREAGVRESIKRGLSYQPRPTDVFISPFAKCGTTWLQQIIHGLKTRGDMDFSEITEVVPWLEMAYFLRLNLDAPQRGPFRAFKSHLNYHDIPKGGRYLISVRDPKDVLVSFFHFLEGWFFEAGSISISEFAREFYMANQGPHSYWYHLASWWEQRHQENVLLLCYEDMKRDLPGTVQAIAHFVGLELDDALQEIVVRQSSLNFMQAHIGKFDDHLVHEKADALLQLPPGGSSTKVRSGRVGDNRVELPEDISAEMDAVWREEIEAKLGLATYQALRDALTEGSNVSTHG
jgi:hypothetical protein